MAKRKKEKIGYSFIAIPRHILISAEYAQLRPPAVKLLVDLFSQFQGSNNGDFCAAWSVMQRRGWRSRDTLAKALKELLTKSFIQKTRQGGKNYCSLYAVTWLKVNECDRKLDVVATLIPSNTWKKKIGTKTEPA